MTDDTKKGFLKNMEALTNGNPVKPGGELEVNLAQFWFEQGYLYRNENLKCEIRYLKQELEKVKRERDGGKTLNRQHHVRFGI